MKKNRIAGIISISFLLCLLLAFVNLQAAQAQTRKKSSRAKSSRVLFLNTDLGMLYDDNIINYSDADVAAFDPAIDNAKFAGLETKNDWIIIPQIRPGVRGKLLGGQNASLTLGYDYYFYIRNDIKRYSRLSVDARHYVNRDGYLALSYGYIPNYFYRNSPVGPVGHSTGYSSAKFAKSSFGAEAGYDITKYFKADVEYRFQHKSYNPEFIARDIDVNRVDFNGTAKPDKSFRFWAGYGIERAKSKYSGTTDTLLLDVSYDAWDLTFGAGYFLPVLNRIRPQVYGSYQYRNIIFQTANYRDVYRAGRKDKNSQVKLGAAVDLAYQVTMAIDYTFLQKNAGFPNIEPGPISSQPVDQLEKSLNYKSNTIAIRFSRNFQM